MRIKGYDMGQLLRGNRVRTLGAGRIHVSSSAILKNVTITVEDGAVLEIGENCVLQHASIYIGKGRMVVDRCALITGDRLHPVKMIVNEGEVHIGHHAKLACDRVWVRFGGKFTIGEYTNVNAGSEIRCDQQVDIGCYNQISYNVRIWDTNTHNILPVEERRRISQDKYPYFGFETARPSTSPVSTGNDCWIGEGAAILKGTQLGDGSVVGFGTFITGKNVPPASMVINERHIKISPLKH